MKFTFISLILFLTRRVSESLFISRGGVKIERIDFRRFSVINALEMSLRVGVGGRLTRRGRLKSSQMLARR